MRLHEDRPSLQVASGSLGGHGVLSSFHHVCSIKFQAVIEWTGGGCLVRVPV
jgi:hypothetical protein